jgi:two-component system sensor histidine kinase KdpD
MQEPDDRPDPDALLRRLQQDEARAKRGKLKIYFGFAPGVGKTYRMLQVAHELREVQKLDVVVGIVEDHRRADTAALVARARAAAPAQRALPGPDCSRSSTSTACSRSPRVVLVDELAHTNAPGSRHPKRWNDVEELLDAGIDVLTTLNVQHVESLNDVVAQITHVQVRETVPDSVLDQADAIELVDIAPEELLRRLEEGKVYLPDQARRASKHFFLRGNLLSLRELALRRTAQHVDEDVREYREEHGVSTTWPAGERILVCVGPAPSSGRLIRAAARMATGLRCPWVAGYVESTALDMMSDADRERLEAHLRVAESLGGSVTRLTGLRVSEALLTYARRNNVTRIIIGKPTHSRLRDRLGGSLLDDVVRGSGEIDVHVISGDDSTEARAPAPPPVSPRVPPEHYLAATAIVGVTLGIAMLLRELFQLPDLEMLFLLAVMAVAGLFGQRPAVLAAALGVACYDFFFVPPFHTFSVEDRRYLLTFGMMFAVGLVMSELATRLRRQERLASGREERTAALYALTRELASAEQPQDIAASAARHVANSFRARVVVLAPALDGVLTPLAAAGSDAALEASDLAVAKWTFEHGQLAGLGTDTLPGSKAVAMPLQAGSSLLGVLVLVPTEQGALRADQRDLLDVFSPPGGGGPRARAALRGSQDGRPAGAHRGDALVLLSAVSHDLRTPLASITGAATVLRDEPDLEPGRRSPSWWSPSSIRPSAWSASSETCST